MRIEVWSDVACPWCYIGKRNLDTALAGYEHAGDVEVRWHSFQLDPAAPADSTERNPQMLARKFGVSVDEARAMNARVTEMAAAAGLEYHLEESIPTNTFEAHRWLHHAFAEGRGPELLERVFAANFTEGKRIDGETVAAIAAELGLEPLPDGAYADAVRADVDEAAALGLGGVPAFVVDRRYLVSGAQPPEALVAALERARADARTAPA